MAVYEYSCRSCGIDFEYSFRSSPDLTPAPTCPCGATDVQKRWRFYVAPKTGSGWRLPTPPPATLGPRPARRPVVTFEGNSAINCATGIVADGVELRGGGNRIIDCDTSIDATDSILDLPDLEIS